MHISEAFPHIYAALSDALDSLGFRVRDAWVVEFLVAELKEMAAAEEETQRLSSMVTALICQGDGSVDVCGPEYRKRLPNLCAFADRTLGRYRDEPGDPRFLA